MISELVNRIFIIILYMLHIRGDHFEVKFMVKCCKFVKRLVKIGTFEFPKYLGGRRTKIWDRGLQCSPSN